jgi:hypothetical protein
MVSLCLPFVQGCLQGRIDRSCILLHPRQDMAVEVQREYDFCSEDDIAFLEGGEFK